MRSFSYIRSNPGATNRSYGIQVAQLAGIPRAAINQANHQLEIMEKNSVDLFADTPQRDLFQEPDELREFLNEVDPDSITPKQALEILYQLRELNR